MNSNDRTYNYCPICGKAISFYAKYCKKCCYLLRDKTKKKTYCIDCEKEINYGAIDADDIERESQGGRIVKGVEMTLDEMRKKGLLDL